MNVQSSSRCAKCGHLRTQVGASSCAVLQHQKGAVAQLPCLMQHCCADGSLLYQEACLMRQLPSQLEMKQAYLSPLYQSFLSSIIVLKERALLKSELIKHFITDQINDQLQYSCENNLLLIVRQMLSSVLSRPMHRANGARSLLSSVANIVPFLDTSSARQDPLLMVLTPLLMEPIPWLMVLTSHRYSARYHQCLVRSIAMELSSLAKHRWGLSLNIHC